MRILLLSAYDTDSHRAWCQGLMEHIPEFQWTYLSLPGRYFSWRIRGNALSWAYGEARQKLDAEYDLILATSMVDLATLKGLVPNLATIPCVMYFHENQFAYPASDKQHSSIEPQMVNLYAALAADYVLFNSHYNQRTLLDGARQLLKRLPDFAPLCAVDAIEQKSSVLPVPINPPKPNTSQHSVLLPDSSLRVIWNHRWEYDKGPEVLHALVTLCEKQATPIHFTIAGNSFRNTPDPLKELQSGSFKCVEHIGTFKEKKDYLKALGEHHVVLSTAHHEFQGLAMLEGCSYGCVPLAPHDLAYPEWVPTQCLYQPSSNPKKQAESTLKQLLHWQQSGLPLLPEVSNYFWPHLAAEYCHKLLKIKEECRP